MGLNFKLDIGPLQISMRVAYQRIDKPINASSFIRDGLKSVASVFTFKPAFAAVPTA